MRQFIYQEHLLSIEWFQQKKMSNKYEVYFLVSTTLASVSTATLVASHSPPITRRNTSMSCGGLRKNGIHFGIHGDELHEFTCKRFDQKICAILRCLLTMKV